MELDTISPQPMAHGDGDIPSDSHQMPPQPPPSDAPVSSCNNNGPVVQINGIKSIELIAKSEDDGGAGSETTSPKENSSNLKPEKPVSLFWYVY